MEKIKKIPLPIAGLILGLAALGNLVRTYSEGLRNIFGIVSGILFLLLLIKIVFNFQATKEELNNPVVATVFPTYSMALMLLSTYLKPTIGETAKVLWIIGVALHIFLMVKVAVKYLPKFDIKTMFPTWFITFVGIVVGSVTAPAFGMENLGQIFFWFGLLSYLVLIPFNIKRVYVLKNMPEPTIPTIAVFAAPGSLLLAGYMSSFPSKNMTMVYFLLFMSQFFYWMVIIQMPKLLNSEFYPSFSAFTFPLVISGIGLKLTNKFLMENGIIIGFLKYMVKFEELISLIIVLYVLLKYIQFIFGDKKPVYKKATS